MSRDVTQVFADIDAFDPDKFVAHLTPDATFRFANADPVTGRERRGWHAAGVDRGDAEKLATRLASERNGRNDQTRSLSFGAYLTRQWLPGKRVVLAASTYAGYHRNVGRHILPALGPVALRGLRPHHLEALYDSLLHPIDGRLGLVC